MSTIKQTIKQAKKAPAKTNDTGFVLWKGASPFDGAPIAAIATLSSKNEKTGNMVQTWIIRTDIAPHEAVKSGDDGSICGGCKFKSGGGCYVTVFQAPLAVYKAYKKGNYKTVRREEINKIGINRKVRIGSYGDGAMVPYYIWKELIRDSEGWTGYTHQYNQSWFDKDMLKLCMVSADTAEESIKYNSMGIRTFTPITAEEEIPSTAIVCPNTTHNIQCIDCKLCNGGINGKSIVVEIHGSTKVINNFTQNRII
jgi:hypothetical protein